MLQSKLMHFAGGFVALTLVLSPAAGQDKQAPVRKLPEIPDLAKLVAPANRLNLVSLRYTADRGNLTRFYNIASSPTRAKRLKEFGASWLAAMAKIDAAELSADEKDKLANLKGLIERDLKEAERQRQIFAEVVPLVPVSATIIALEETRARQKTVDARAAAGQLTAMKKQLADLQKLLQDAQAGEAKFGGAPFSKLQIVRGADLTASLRNTLKDWYTFYNTYDPLFSWWVGEPYKHADAALLGHVNFLRKLQGEPDKAETPAPAAAESSDQAVAQTNDAPDLQQLIALPRSELIAMLDAYQADRRAQGPLTGLPIGGKGARTPERIAELKTHYGDWLAALRKLDFDKLNQESKVDYLLVRHQLQRDLRRLELEALPAPEKLKGGGKIVRPIGREALIAELAGEMIPYSPEELLVIAQNEYRWCEAEMKKASRDMGIGDDWHKALEKVKTLHVEPGKQPEMIDGLAREAIDYVQRHQLVSVPPVAASTWRMEMMTPQRQLVNPFFTGGEVISVSYPTSTMAHDAKLQSMRGNNIHFSRATVQHELIPGHHLQLFMTARYNTQRRPFNTPFWIEGWALYWEFVLYDHGLAKTPEDRVGFMFWRMHRCARIVFSFSYHLGKMTPEECVDYLVARVGHERDNATAEVRRSFEGNYSPLYQAAYMLGGLQIRAMRRELVESGKWTETDFHDAILRAGNMPIEMVRILLTQQPVTGDFQTSWKFYGPIAP
jgi:uncharacterized protein (DUF885 family)